MFRQIAFPLEAVRPQEVCRGIVLAMFVLDAVENRELTLRAEVDFELRHAVDPVIVHTLAVAAVGFAARLPVAVEDVSRIT